MRIAVLSLMVVGLVACHRQAPPQEDIERSSPATNRVADEPEPRAMSENVGNAQAPATEPANDPTLANLSPARRREYDRGYRDCRRGAFNYDPDRQGEFYRIGCMAAENAKAGTEP